MQLAVMSGQDYQFLKDLFIYQQHCRASTSYTHNYIMWHSYLETDSTETIHLLIKSLNRFTVHLGTYSLSHKFAHKDF